MARLPFPSARKAIRELDLDLAAADLRLAVSLGFTDLALIRSHPDSAVLVERQDVKALIKSLEAPDRMTKPQGKR